MPCSECVIAVIDFDCFMGKHLISNTFYVYNISKQKYVCTCCIKKKKFRILMSPNSCTQNIERCNMINHKPNSSVCFCEINIS